MSPLLHELEPVPPARLSELDRGLTEVPARRFTSLHLLTLGLIGLSYWILSRSCGYNHVAIAAYGMYVLLYVWLPGHCLLASVEKEPVSLSRSLALALPLGFACEIAIYMMCSATGFRGQVSGVAMAGTLTLLAVGCRKRGWRGMMPVLGAPSPAVMLGLAGVFLLVMVSAAARMYAPSPLDEGRLLHSTHQDWVYLLSRAMEIKGQWPLQDPSLAGTPLGYHYFLMTHAASAANVTGVEVALVLFRLSQMTMAVALLMQVFILGRRLGGSAAAGVVAAVLLFGAGEVSWRESTSGGWFGSLFVEWLYVSPTFFFGIIFMGSLLLWVSRLVSAARMTAGDGVVLLVLSTAATGAKGTVMIPLIMAVAGWSLLRIRTVRSWQWRLVVIGALMSAGFLGAFTLVLRAWSGDGTAVSPLAFSAITAFWQEHAVRWQQALQQSGLPVRWSEHLAGGACAGVIFAGSTGVMLLGFAYAWRRQKENEFVWLGLVAAACMVSGQMLYLDSHGEIYLYLPARLPLAALTGAALVALWRRWHQGGDAAHRCGVMMAVTGLSLLFVAIIFAQGIVSVGVAAGLGFAILYVLGSHRVAAVGVVAASGWRQSRARTLGYGISILVLAVVAGLQINYELLGSRSGLKLWLWQGAIGREPGVAKLHEALDWIRRESPTDTVVISNLFTPATLDTPEPSVADRTTLDKHYYYSALSQRPTWVEGPSYLRDRPEARRRMLMIQQMLMTGKTGPVLAEVGRPCYLVMDKLGSGAERAPLAGARLIFANERAAVYALSPN